jgi:predicted nucleic acid-binding protein
LSNPAYPSEEKSFAELAGRLQTLCATSDHHFWPDSASLLDDTLFRAASIDGHRKITDAYLLGLAVRNHGRLATFDRSIPMRAVVGALQHNLVLIASD